MESLKNAKSTLLKRSVLYKKIQCGTRFPALSTDATVENGENATMNFLYRSVFYKSKRIWPGRFQQVPQAAKFFSKKYKEMIGTSKNMFYLTGTAVFLAQKNPSK